jgi:hypothetical protein
VESKLTCFSGGHSFVPDTTDAKGTLLTGGISGGAMAFGPAGMKFRLPVVAGESLILDLKAARIAGTVSGSGIANGVIAGAVSQSDLQTKVVPTVAKMLNNILKDR